MASNHIAFDSSWRADSNEALPDSSRHLPAAVSVVFYLLSSKGMQTLWDIHHCNDPIDRYLQWTRLKPIWYAKR